MDIDKRVTELEIQISYQDNTIDELNRVVISQQKQIEGLQEKIELMEKEIKNNPITEPFDVKRDKPPHY